MIPIFSPSFSLLYRDDSGKSTFEIKRMQITSIGVKITSFEICREKCRVLYFTRQIDEQKA